jgi:hypothetical protein
MPAELFLNATQGVGVMYGLSAVNTLYMFSFLFAVFFAIIIAVRFNRPMAGLLTFVLALFIFSLLGMFPLWVLALPVVLIIAFGLWGKVSS